MSRFDIAKQIRNAWSSSAPLTGTAVLMLVAFIASVAGLFMDDRIVTGVPVWLKPAKFAISTSIFTGTLAWVFRYISIWPRFVRAMGWVISVVLILEVAIIDVQAARGTTSHFNVSTPLDSALFGIMGIAIAALWLASVGLFVALAKQKFSNVAWGWWLRLGMLTTVLGSAAGGFMLRATPAQSQELQITNFSNNVGAHTVGGADGGPGLPGVGWSTQHGDLRIAHFLGLHGLQLLPLFGWFLLRRNTIQSARNQIRMAFAATASYIGLIGILTWQALRGQSVIAPDSTTLAAIAVWLTTTILTGVVLTRHTTLHRGSFTTSRTTI
jgi:hypothetical protein